MTQNWSSASDMHDTRLHNNSFLRTDNKRIWGIFSMSETRSIQCRKCGHEVDGGDPDNYGPCPECDCDCWDIRVEFEEKVRATDETIGELIDEDGSTISERINKTDLNTDAEFSMDKGQPATVNVSRNIREGGFKEEGDVAKALVRSYNAINGTSYEIEKKESEDGDYVDRSMVSITDEPQRINIQIRNLDDEMAAALGKSNQFQGARSSSEFITSIQEAIDDKATVDPNEKLKTILQLFISTPLGKMIYTDIKNSAFDCKGFKAIWISPFREDSFPLGCILQPGQ